METIASSQLVYFERLSKLQNAFKRTSKVVRTVSYLENLYDKVQSIFAKFEQGDRDIMSLVNDAADYDSKYFKDDLSGKFDELYLEFSSEIKQLLRASGALVGPLSETKDNSGLEVKLPQITLPTFDGNYKEWISFRNLFTSLIHNRKTITNIEKLHYLKCNLVGEPSNLVKHLTITESNYAIAWKLLHDRYDNSYMILLSQFKELFGIEWARENSNSLKSLLDRTNECVQSIENLGIEDPWDAILVFMTSERLPKDTRQLWEQMRHKEENFGSFDDLKKFLNLRFRALEAAGVNRQTHQKLAPSSIRKVHTVVKAQIEACVLCKGSHKLENCKEFIALSPIDRFSIVKRNGLCLKCLAKGHLVLDCRSKLKCSKCNRSHNTLLHRETVQNDSNTSTTISKSSNNIVREAASPFSEIETCKSNTFDTKKVLIPTALVRLDCGTRSTVLRALLDQGSQTSLISESAVQRLGLQRRNTGISISGIGHSTSHNVKGLTTATLRTNGNQTIEFEALILEKISNRIPSQSACFPNNLNREDLADPDFEHPGPIDILLGADIYARIILDKIYRMPSGPIAQETRLGWIVSGEIDTSNQFEFGLPSKIHFDDTSKSKEHHANSIDAKHPPWIINWN